VVHLITLVWMALVARPHPAEASWSASVPLWMSLSPAGKIVDAGPGPPWMSTPPAARLGAPQESLPTNSTELPPPRELPDVVSESKGPTLPPPRTVSTFATEPSQARLNLSPVPPGGPPPLAVQATQRTPVRTSSPKP
jgi:hypothetical protein